MNSFFSLLFLILFTVDQLEACSCVRKDADFTFQRAAYVSRVLIEKVEKIIDDGHVHEMVYTVKHLDVYKSPDNKQNLPTQVRTAGDQGRCGVNLNKGQEIVIAGTSRPSYLQIDLCTHGIIGRADAERLMTINS